MTEPVPATINLIISQRNNKPCLELRRVTTEPNLIKSILTAAFHQQPIIIQPTFKNRLESINTLIKKGIVYKDEEKYYYII